MEIVARQISGLGNQLFQYAAGRYYANRYDASLRIILDAPQNAHSHGYPRPFLLSHFSIAVAMEPMSVLDRLMLSSRSVVKPAAAVMKRLQHVQCFTEPVAQRYKFLESLPLQPGVRTLYLSGYWQAHRIADEMEAQLRAELAFREQPVGRNLEVLEQIQDCASAVSLHVRRGDYTLAAEGNIALPMSYYAGAIEHFRKRLVDPVFFVFSDDIAFARANLPRDVRAVFVDHNDHASAHEDLRLMSACQHHVIANSTFSWWGAWLNPRVDKMVYAPKFWHLTPDSYYPDLMPPQWTLALV